MVVQSYNHQQNTPTHFDTYCGTVALGSTTVTPVAVHRYPGQARWVCLAVIREVLHFHEIKVDARDYDDRTPLSYAARYGRYEVVELLIERGAKLDLGDNDGRTPLWYEGNRAPIVAVLPCKKSRRVIFECVTFWIIDPTKE